MARGKSRLGALLAVSIALGQSSPAQAIPAFARKYGTSCQTCHVVYPKLTPFGEAFRHNGYRFPGVDSDFIKQEPVALGQDANKKTFPHTVWPASIPNSVPLAFGANGQAIIHPDKNSGGARADNGTIFTLNDLVAEAHVFAGGTIDDRIAYWAEVTYGTDGGLSVEHAEVIVSDLLGPKHALNLWVGRGFTTLTPFGPHSSYVADLYLPALPVTQLFGATSSSWNLVDNYNLVELNGVLLGRLEYSVGVNAGANLDIRPTENVYGHLGLKLGGQWLDGEGGPPPNAARPWEETALTLYAFAYHSNSRFSFVNADTAETEARQDTAATFGGGLRGQWRSLELNAGFWWEKHNHANTDQSEVRAWSTFGELSYVVYPWLVPSVRVEYTNLQPEGAGTVTDLRLIPGIAALVRPDLRITLVGLIERAGGAPPGGWGPAGGSALPPDPGSVVSTELEALTLGLAWAF
ncbi:MAG TPA: hypothetical protein VGK67_35820 [Myxococcales bacterium]|jgi:hypothetical protein